MPVGHATASWPEIEPVQILWWDVDNLQVSGGNTLCMRGESVFTRLNIAVIRYFDMSPCTLYDGSSCTSYWIHTKITQVS